LTLLLIVTGLSSSADASSSRQALWIQKYGTGLYGTNIAYHLAVSPDGRRAYVTGESQKYGGSPDIVTIAYEADAGSQLWLSRYDGPGHAIDFPTAIGTSPDGTTLYVAGWVGSVGGGSDFGTIAYDSATGGELWTRLFNGPAGSFDNVSALAVNPIKPIVYVTGPSVTDGLGNSDYLTFAYDAATGDILWQRYLHGAPVTDDFPTDIAVTHDGSTVYVTGASRKPEYECATVAYDATTGHSEWVKRIHSRYPETNGCVDVDVAPDDSRVYLAGGIGADNPDFLTLALSPADGSVEWRRRWDAPAHGEDLAEDADLSADGTTFYTMGPSVGQGTGEDYALLAYDAATGGKRWAVRYDGPASGDDRPMGVATSSVTGSVYVTGVAKAVGDQYDYDYGTIAYAPSGKRLWVRHYSSRIDGEDIGYSVAASPSEPVVYVTGRGNAPYQWIYVTLAYAA